MVNLTPRLMALASEIKEGETMADIGTDHGFLPAFLWEKAICPHVIMADVSAGSLEKAKTNCSQRFSETTQFDFRLGDGLQVLEPAEVDVVVIAGMGGILMTEIMERDLEKSLSFNRFVLQPRNNVGRLRHWLYHHGFSIINEQLVREGKYICEILTAIPKEVAVTKDLGADRIEYQYPRKLLEFRNSLTQEYLMGKLHIEEEILQSMIEGKQPSKKLRAQRYRIDYLNDLLHDEEKLHADM
ncbi:MAG: SAM-dependent methyltransferase [Firmicutes bacterium]|nr:SAM-dependent methyltransferase [Bacillota bacterium]